MARQIGDSQLFASDKEHVVAVEAFATALRSTRGKVRLGKRTSNLFRARHSSVQKLDAESFARTLWVDVEAGFAEVQGMCTFEHFVDACLAFGCMPAVVPELRTITVGGAVSGVGIEATSFRYGLVHECVDEIEVLCGDGQVRVCRADNENAELFRAIPNSYGTLGYILRLRCKVLPVRKSVRACYTHFADRSAFLAAMDAACDLTATPTADFVEGVCWNATESTLIVASHCDDAPDMDMPGREPYYQRLRRRNSAVLSVRDWIWRWDPDWFWCSRFYGMENPLLRRLLGRFMLRSERYWKVLDFYRRHRIEERVAAARAMLGMTPALSEPVIQDVEVPMRHAHEFLDFYDSTLDIRPLWVCPIRPLSDAQCWTLYNMPPGELHLNFGFWQGVPTTPDLEPGHFNRMLERMVDKLEGRKSLYSASYYPEIDFWRIYNGDAYKSLKARFDPSGRFADLYQKTVLRR